IHVPSDLELAAGHVCIAAILSGPHQTQNIQKGWMGFQLVDIGEKNTPGGCIESSGEGLGRWAWRAPQPGFVTGSTGPSSLQPWRVGARRWLWPTTLREAVLIKDTLVWKLGQVGLDDPTPLER